MILFLLIIYYLKYDTQIKPAPKPSILINSERSISSDSLAKTQIAPVNSFGPPIRLIIPVIDIDANIQHLGVNLKGEMDVPDNIIDVGWFKFGSLPGEIGSAVIAGHFNGKKNEAGVFANLNKLKKGDQIFIKNDKNQLITFIVKQIRFYDPGYAESIFNSNDNAHLNLITCDGTWDKIKKTYNKRLVILADISL